PAAPTAAPAPAETRPGRSRQPSGSSGPGSNASAPSLTLSRNPRISIGEEPAFSELDTTFQTLRAGGLGNIAQQAAGSAQQAVDRVRQAFEDQMQGLSIGAGNAFGSGISIAADERNNA